MTEVVSGRKAALQPLREALLDRAHAEADRLRSAAEAEGEQLLQRARDETAALLAEARRKGEADGMELLAAEETAGRRSARARVLDGDRGVFEELRRRASVSVHQLLQDEGRRAQLATALRDALGEAASVSDTADGGLFAQAPDGRSIDASVGALVSTGLADLDLEPLWTAR